MGIQLSQETEAALKKLAREIGNSRGLDEDAREELYGHLEDKTLGYLSGEDGITEADAVLLTREHFGDPGAFAEFGVKAEPFRSRVSLPRRLAAVAVLTVAVGVVFEIAKLPIAWCLDKPSALVFFGSAGRPWMFMLDAMNLGVIFVFLRSWTTLERRDLSVWYQHCAPSRFALLLLALVILDWCVPGVRPDQAAFAAGHEQFLYALVRMPHSIIYLYIGVDLALNLLAPMLWIWWGEQRTKRMKAIVVSAAAWAGFSVVTFIPSIIFGKPTYLLGETTSKLGLHEIMPLSTIQQAFGIAPDSLFATVMVATGYMAGAVATFAGVAIVMYVLLGWMIRTLRRFRGIEIRLRPVAR